MIGNAVHVLRIATGEIEETFPVDDGKNKAAQALGQMGGRARAKGLSAKRRKEIAKKLDEANQKEATIQTMIFEPATLRLDLAIGKGPTSAKPMKILELATLLKKE